MNYNTSVVNNNYEEIYHIELKTPHSSVLQHAPYLMYGSIMSQVQ